MYQLLPQFILLASVATIILIVLRRLPEVTIAEDETDRPEERQSVPQRIISLIRRGVRFLIQYATEAKDHTLRAHYLERFAKVLRLRSLKAPKEQSARATANPVLKDTFPLVPAGGGDKAEQEFLRTIEHNPGNRGAYERLGKLYLERQKFKEAAEVYQYLTEQYPDEDVYWSRLGLAEFNRGAYEEARSAYSQAVRLRPDRTIRLINLSICYEVLGQLEQAVLTAEQAVEQEPNNVYYLTVLADLLLAQGKQQAAVETFERILELEPTNEQARQKLMSLKF